MARDITDSDAPSIEGTASGDTRLIILDHSSHKALPLAAQHTLLRLCLSLSIEPSSPSNETDPGTHSPSTHTTRKTPTASRIDADLLGQVLGSC